MKAVQLARFGGPEVLETIEIPLPQPGPGEVRIGVRAAGVNFFEVLMRADRYAATPDLPMILGVEAAGVVDAAGPGVDPAWIGRRVAAPLFAAGRGSGHAEAVVIGADFAVPLPEDLGFEDAVALLVQGLTALHLVRRSAVEGRAIVVTAAAGGVGSLLVQLARRAGAARVIAVAGTAAKQDLALSLGADAAIDGRAPDWPAAARAAAGDHGANVVFDLVGGDATEACLQALAPGGDLVFTALGRLTVDRAALEDMVGLGQSLRGFALLPLLTPAGLQADLAELFGLAASGQIQVVRGGSYPLDRAAEAHAAIEDRRTTGKVVLVP